MSPDPSPEARRIPGWPRYGWWRVILSLTAVLVLGVAALAALRFLARPLALLVLGIVLGAGLSPLVAWLERRMPRALAVLAVYLLLILLLIGLGWLIVPTIVEQAAAVVERLPELFNLLQNLFERWSGRLDGLGLLDTLPTEIGRLGGQLLQLPFGVAGALVDALVVIFVSLYALLEAPGIRRFALSLVPPARQQRLDHVLTETVQAMGGYLRGTTLSGLAVGILTYVGLLIIGVDYALVLALIAGILELVPVIGPIVASIPMLAVALLDSPTQALVVLIFVTVLQQTESNVLLPYIMRSQTDVSPLLTIIALVAGSAVGGLLGALVAIPLAAALRVLTREVIAPAIRGWTGAPPSGQVAENGDDSGE